MLVQEAGEMRMPVLWNDREMRRLYGTDILYHQPLFRVVQADSRQHIIGGNIRDRDSRPDDDKTFIAQGMHDKSVIRERAEYRYAPLYPGFHGWVVERYMTAEQFAGSEMIYHLTNFDEASGLYSTGPYPYRGEYVEVMQIPQSIYPTIAIVQRIIWMAEKSRSYSYREKLAAQKDAAEKQEKAVEGRNADILREASKRTLKRTQILDIQNKLRYSAEELGLPMNHGQFFTPPQNSKRRIELCQD